MRGAIASLVYATCVASVFAVDSSLLALAPANSGALAGINIQQIRESSFGKLLEARRGDPAFKALVERLGFDPLRDADEALIAVSSNPALRPFLLVRGRFDAVKTASPRHEGYLPARAVVDRSLLVAGEEAAIREFVRQRVRSAGLNAAIAAKAAEMAKTFGVWVLVSEPPSAFIPQGPNPGRAGKLIESVEQASLGVKFGSEIAVSARAVARTPEDAQGLVSAVGFLSWMATATQPADNGTAAILQKMNVRSEGRETKVSLVISEAEAERLVRAAFSGSDLLRP